MERCRDRAGSRRNVAHGLDFDPGSLTQVRHGVVRAPPNTFRICLGGCQVCTTFCVGVTQQTAAVDSRTDTLTPAAEAFRKPGGSRLAQAFTGRRTTAAVEQSCQKQLPIRRDNIRGLRTRRLAKISNSYGEQTGFIAVRSCRCRLGNRDQTRGPNRRCSLRRSCRRCGCSRPIRCCSKLRRGFSRGPNRPCPQFSTAG